MYDYRLLAELAEDWGWDDLAAVVFPGHLPDRIVLAALNAHARIFWNDPLHTYSFGSSEHLYLRFAPCPDSARCGCGTNHPEAIDTPTPHPVTFIDFT